MENNNQSINQLPDQNPMPSFNLLPAGLRALGERAIALLSNLPSCTDRSLSTHHRGAVRLLDEDTQGVLFDDFIDSSRN